MHGKCVVHPVNGRKIPIICDAELVDMSFGTGAVKVSRRWALAGLVCPGYTSVTTLPGGRVLCPFWPALLHSMLGRPAMCPLFLLCLFAECFTTCSAICMLPLAAGDPRPRP
jgi:hypothetical protein